MKISKKTFQPEWLNKFFFAETRKTDQTASDKKFVLLSSEILKAYENVKAKRNLVKNRSTATARAIHQLTHSLKYFLFGVVHTKHFSNIVFQFESYTLYLDLVYNHLKGYRSAFVS